MGTNPKEAPNYERLANQIEEMVHRNALLPGDRVPSLRELRSRTNYSITTIQQAYFVLENKGLIEARPRSGYFVVQGVKLSREPQESPETLDLVSFPETSLGTAFLPSRTIFRQLKKLARSEDPRLLSEAPDLGNKELRAILCRRQLSLDPMATTEEVLITSGDTESRQLCLRTLGSPSGKALVISPIDSVWFNTIERLGMSFVEFPDKTESHLDLVSLDRFLDRVPVDFAIVSTHFRSPWGPLIEEDQKESFVRLFERRSLPIIEEDIQLDASSLPLKAFDRKRSVLHCSSFSSTIAPGLGVAAVHCGKFVQKMAVLKSISSRTSTVAQRLVFQYLSSGGFDRNLRRRQHRLANQWAFHNEAVEGNFPKSWLIFPPSGPFRWLKAPTELDALRFYENASANRLSVSLGKNFTRGKELNHLLRLTFNDEWSASVEEAIKTLSRLASNQ